MKLTELEENFTKEELTIALESIHDKSKLELLMKTNIKLANLILDTETQNSLFEFFNKRNVVIGI